MSAETSNARGEVEYEYEVWQRDAWQAGGSTPDYASAQSEADHYAMMYGQDGPVEVRIYEKRLLAAAPQPAAARGDVRGLVDYDAGLLNDFGGGDVNWWQDYLRAEIERANEFWREQTEQALAAEGVQAGEVEEQPEARGVVDEAMVERALIADAREYGASIPESRARRLLAAALTGERNG